MNRDALVAQYGFAIPTDEALDAIAAWSPAGVIEVGAGVAYWARLLADRGVDVLAFDLAPPPSPKSEWFAGSMPWYHVAPSDDTIAALHTDRTLLLIWPTRGALWAARALELFHAEGGRRIVYVGEGPGGRTGDEVFHARLGELSTCTSCRYGTSTTCICAAPPLWRRVGHVSLPHWEGFSDDLYLYERMRRPGGWLRALKWRAGRSDTLS